MKFFPNIPVVFAALGLVGSASAATTISYSYYTATGSGDTSWVSPVGSTSIKAVNFGGGQTTFGGVTWLVGNQGGATYNDTSPIGMWFSAPGQAWASNHPDFYNDGTPLLEEGAYSNLSANGVDFTLDMSGFTVGQQYLVQFVVVDSRNDWWGPVGRTITIDGYSANIASQDSTAYQYAFGDSSYAVVTAQFTPDAGDTSFSFRPLISGGSGGLQINAVQVLTVVPEPGSALLGALGMLALLRRKR